MGKYSCPCDLEDHIYGLALDGNHIIEEVTGEHEVIEAATDAGTGMVIVRGITQDDVMRTGEICTAIKMGVTTTSIIKIIT